MYILFYYSSFAILLFLCEVLIHIEKTQMTRKGTHPEAGR